VRRLPLGRVTGDAGGVNGGRLAELFELLLSSELLALLDEHVRQVAHEAAREELARQPQRQWLPLAEAAAQLGCTPDALRMRVKRGSVEARRQGRRLYVCAEMGSDELDCGGTGLT
jgi:hypothetical protein